MHPAQTPSARINPATVLWMRKEKRYSFKLPPLTPEQLQEAREKADKVLERVFG